jgi:hypothetical protein
MTTYHTVIGVGKNLFDAERVMVRLRGHGTKAMEMRSNEKFECS